MNTIDQRARRDDPISSASVRRLGRATLGAGVGRARGARGAASSRPRYLWAHLTRSASVTIPTSRPSSTTGRHPNFRATRRAAAPTADSSGPMVSTSRSIRISTGTSSGRLAAERLRWVTRPMTRFSSSTTSRWRMWPTRIRRAARASELPACSTTTTSDMTSRTVEACMLSGTASRAPDLLLTAFMALRRPPTEQRRELCATNEGPRSSCAESRCASPNLARDSSPAIDVEISVCVPSAIETMAI